MTKLYRRSVLQTRKNHQASSLTNVIWRKTNQNAFTKKLKKKYAKNEADYEEYSVTDEVPSYFNIFECGRNILNRLDMTYE